MAYFPKKDAAAAVQVETPVWKCSDADCVGWMRVEFALEQEPNCPLCGSSMSETTRMLPKIAVPKS